MEDFQNPYKVQNIFGAVLIGASVSLTLNSVIRMAIMRTGVSRMIHFPIINAMMLLNEFAIAFITISSSHKLIVNWYLWTSMINNFTYLLIKPTLLYLAFWRCRAVCGLYRKYPKFHYFMMATRAIQLFTSSVVNLYGAIQCGGSNDPECPAVLPIQNMDDVLEPVFIIYYIISEVIFYCKLCGTLRAVNSCNTENIHIWRYLFYQVMLFTLDLASLTLSSIYRIMIIANSNLPNYIYSETLSYALTIFVMTGLGLSIPKLRTFSQMRQSNKTEPEFINDPEKNPEYDCDVQVSTFGVFELKSFKETQDETSGGSYA